MTLDDVSAVRMSKGNWGKVRAYATVTFSSGLSLRGIKLIEGKKGLFVGMPSRQTKKDGEMTWEDCAYFEDKEDFFTFNNFLVEHYEKDPGGNGGSAPTVDSAGEENDETSFL